MLGNMHETPLFKVSCLFVPIYYLFYIVNCTQTLEV